MFATPIVSGVVAIALLTWMIRNDVLHRDEHEEFPIFIKIVNSPRALAVMGLTIVIISSIVFHYIEHASVFNSVYWTIVTGLGIGYGDITPKHDPGRVLTMCLGITTELFYIPMIISSISSRLIVDRNAFTNAEQEEIKHDIRKILTALGIQHDIEEEREAGD